MSTVSSVELSKLTEVFAKRIVQALRVLLAGFDVANQRSREVLLRECSPTDLYDSLTAVLLRSIFLLYAEDRNLLTGAGQENELSLTKLIYRLEADAENDIKGMGQRFTGWKQVIELFQLVGRQYATKGGLFDPDAYPLLGAKTLENDLPLVDDLCVHEVLQLLRYVDKQPLSFQTLDIEHFGSVYELLLSYTVEQATAPCLRLLPDGVVVSLEALRRTANPYQWLCTQLEEKKLPKSVDELKKFAPSEQVITDYDRLEKHLSARLLGKRIPKGHHYLQSASGRRWSGSHYTPKVLSGPIVEKTLSPLLGENPTEEQILALKICDPAMGSGAFLAMACRYLGERLVEAWSRAGKVNEADNAIDLVNKARRMVAERCLYGVDRNPRAVQLARLSLWIVTASKNDSFAFLDHALKEGDAIIGCTLEQIAAFQTQYTKQPDISEMYKQLEIAKKTRERFISTQLALPFGGHEDVPRDWFRLGEHQQVSRYKVIGDALVASMLAGGSTTAMKKRIRSVAKLVRTWQISAPLPQDISTLLNTLPFKPFHWHLEFPEVFQRGRSTQKGCHGFDAIVGNPPFAGQNTIIASNGDNYIKVLQQYWPHAHGNSDLCSYFFLRTAELLRKNACFGLIATNSISQGHTRSTGLQYIVNHSEVELYDALIDRKWPVAGATVVVSIIQGKKGKWQSEKYINGAEVGWINSEMEPCKELPDPVSLKSMEGLAFMGSKIYGNGFTLTAAERTNLKLRNERNGLLIQPYLGGQELNRSPTLSFHRYVINFGVKSLEQAEEYPDLIQWVREKVKPERDKLKTTNTTQSRRRELWWQYGSLSHGLYTSISGLSRCLVLSEVSTHLLLAFQSTQQVFSHTLKVFAFSEYRDFAVLQSQVHECWARKFSSTLGKALRYTPSSCFQTYPFPRPNPQQSALLTSTGKALYEKRAAIMLANQIGMTETWNRLVDDKNPHYYDKEILALRQLRHDMDRAVLDAYGWADLEPTATQRIIARLRQLNAERAQEESA